MVFSYVGYFSDTNDMILFAKNHDLQDRITLYNMKVKMEKNKTKSHTRKIIKETKPDMEAGDHKESKKCNCVSLFISSIKCEIGLLEDL